MVDTNAAGVFEDLDIGEEQVTSNECWNIFDELGKLQGGATQGEQASSEGDFTSSESDLVYQDLDLRDEQVLSNECYQQQGE